MQPSGVALLEGVRPYGGDHALTLLVDTFPDKFSQRVVCPWSLGFRIRCDGFPALENALILLCVQRFHQTVVRGVAFILNRAKERCNVRGAGSAGGRPDSPPVEAETRPGRAGGW